MTTDSPAKKALTPTQQSALATNQDIFVEAGAGSGKTTVLVERYLKILSENPTLDIHNVVAFTFTKKAANELLTRIQETVQESTLEPTGRHYRYPKDLRDTLLTTLHLARISTIHTFATQLLRKYPLEAGIDPNFTILDQTQSKLLQKKAIDETLTQLIQTHHADIKTYLLTYSLRQLKFHLNLLFQNPPTTQPEDPDALILNTLFTLCKTTYQTNKQDQAVLDYDDIITKCVQLLTQNPTIQHLVQQDCHYLMVDEFQDTDPEQWHLIQSLNPKNLFLVGDLKQSIYAFRGSNPKIFQEGMDYIQEKNGKIIHLADNFRTQKTVLDFINPFFQTLFEPTLPYTPLIPFKSETTGTVTTSLENATRQDEFTAIAHYIKQKQHQNPTLNLKDIAILLRSKSQMESLQNTLTQHNLTSLLLTPTGFYQREEIILIYNLLKGLLNPADNLAWKRILIDPIFFNIPEETLYPIYPKTPQTTLIQALQTSPHTQAAKKITAWLSLTHLYPLHTLVEHILQDSQAWQHIAAQSNGQKRIENLTALLKKMAQLDEDPFFSHQDLLDHIAHAIQTAASETTAEIPFQDNHISILTIHAAKGLEFPIVIIGDCSKTFNLSKSAPGIIKTLTPVDEEACIEEEKRIFYVACTRTKDHLFLVGRETGKKARNSFLGFIEKSSEQTL